MFLSHAEVYFEFEHARDIVGIWMFSLNLDTLCMIVTLRTIVSTGICKYGQLVFELKRFKVFIGGYHESLLSDKRGNPCAYEVENRTTNNQ